MLPPVSGTRRRISSASSGVANPQATGIPLHAPPCAGSLSPRRRRKSPVFPSLKAVRIAADSSCARAVQRAAEAASPSFSASHAPSA